MANIANFLNNNNYVKYKKQIDLFNKLDAFLFLALLI